MSSCAGADPRCKHLFGPQREVKKLPSFEVNGNGKA